MHLATIETLDIVGVRQSKPKIGAKVFISLKHVVGRGLDLHGRSLGRPSHLPYVSGRLPMAGSMAGGLYDRPAL
jgi:hypothetical protein